MAASRWIAAATCVLGALAGVGNTETTHAATLTVCQSGCRYSQIQPAVDAAAGGDTISVGPGTYTGGISIAKNLTLVGSGTASTVISSGNPVVAIAPQVQVTIDNLSVTGGNSGTVAGGIYNQGTLSLSAVVVTNNSGKVGGIWDAKGAAVTLTNVTISMNQSQTFGAVFVESSATLFGVGVTITDNSAAGAGGGIANIGTLALSQTTITENHSRNAGGGLYNTGTVTLTGVTIANNDAALSGGGIENFGNVSLVDSSVTRNLTVGGLNSGGGIHNSEGGTVSLTNTQVTENTPDNCVGCGESAPGPGLPPSPVQTAPYLSRGPGGRSAGFLVSFPSKVAGQGYVLFGPGPGCAGLVETATQDAGAGTTQHLVRVTGDDMNLGAGAVLPGATYSFEVVMVTASGVERDTNGGKCYTVTIPSG